MSCGADVLVAGDALHPYRGMPVVTPADFLDLEVT
jgi:hypothetical protein